MSLQELIEMAILDAMGLLDEREQASFEAAFRVASPAIQAQVRREQTRLSRIEALLPDVTPPAGLRAAVLAVLREQIASSAIAAGAVSPTMFKSRGVSPIWRAASLGLAAAAVVLGVTHFEWKRQYSRMEDSIREGSLLSSMREGLGATYVKDVLFSRDTRRVLIRPVADGFTGEASIFLNPEWSSAKFFGTSITTPENQPYRLALIDDNENVVQVLARISSDGRLFSSDVSLAANAKGQIAIIANSDPDGVPVILGKADLSS